MEIDTNLGPRGSTTASATNAADNRVHKSVDITEKAKINRDSPSIRATTAKEAVNTIRRIVIQDLTPAMWELMQQNLASVLTYIEDTEKERGKIRMVDGLDTSSQAKGIVKTWAAIAAQAPGMRLAAKEDWSWHGTSGFRIKSNAPLLSPFNWIGIFIDLLKSSSSVHFCGPNNVFTCLTH